MLVDSLIGIESELLQLQRDDGDRGEPRFHLIERGRYAHGVLEPGLQPGVGLFADALAERLSGGTHARFEQFGLSLHGFHLSRIRLEDDGRGTLVGLLDGFCEGIKVLFRKVNRTEQINAVAAAMDLPQRMRIPGGVPGLSRQPFSHSHGQKQQPARAPTESFE